MSKHERLKQEALAALSRLFSDTSVDPGETQSSLEDIATELSMMIESLKQQANA